MNKKNENNRVNSLLNWYLKYFADYLPNNPNRFCKKYLNGRISLKISGVK
jgi:hypothetical protein